MGIDRRIRVVHLVTTLAIGGLEVMVLKLISNTDRRRFAPRVFVLGEAGQLGPAFQAQGIELETLPDPLRSRGRALLQLCRRLRKMRPHVLHTHNPTPHYYGALAARAAGVPVVLHTKHGQNRPELPKMVAMNRLASLLTDCIVPVSADAARVALTVERIPRRKLHIIRNGVDLTDFAARGDRMPGKRVIHVARLNLVKDQRTLLAAARLVADAEPDFRLELIGDGPLRVELEAQCDQLDLRRHVFFRGFQSPVAPLLAEADLFVLPSLVEGLSMTLLEAMASGLPVVATRVGGNPEVVVDGQTGLLVRPQSPDLLAAAILRLLRDPPVARRMGEAGRQRVVEAFDMQQVAAGYERLYLRLLRC